jgi:hypothetical protein
LREQKENNTSNNGKNNNTDDYNIAFLEARADWFGLSFDLFSSASQGHFGFLLPLKNPLHTLPHSLFHQVSGIFHGLSLDMRGSGQFLRSLVTILNIISSNRLHSWSCSDRYPLRSLFRHLVVI